MLAELMADAGVRELVEALGRKGLDMREHAERVAGIASAIAAAMKLSSDSARSVALGGLLHEVGKLDVPDTILFKPANLNADEMRVMRTYPSLGYERLRALPSCACAAEIVYAHRVNFDGSGYPHGLKGADIPLGARIVAVACAFSTFVSDRPHDVSRALSFARGQVLRWSGTSFDPAVVEVLLDLPDGILIPLEMRTAVP